ncbi:unnamed protein product (macronuclear) [Paramecium tetraurelia]|uniref:UDP-N-acetylglucosamine diphosphorylase n=1 Tax=Paramecium tetraurelia TaxID=5888 RepID=A0E0D2_PARTE|nr:uncharacterized protein GSPATT00021917001 [Paramecium tetraurelia]CAK88749.1 unnamed protein product [Paramecium tetraurelia]|eukprot:XP_001456146.1 hypothetical protein (macronuclear) [Paramecium tetraurelia strain d4-2]
MRKKVSNYQDYQECKQQHLLNYLSTLEEKDQEKLLEKLESINIRNLLDVYSHYKERLNENCNINPIRNVFKVSSTPQETLQQYQKLGEQLISKGKVCVAMMAGGQGTRLGFNMAKGMYDIGMPSHKTLFQIFCERILSLQNMIQIRMGQCLPIQFFIMTSDVNHEETKRYFIENNYFNLQSDQITFFQQDSLPILSKDGEILLSDHTSILEGPDGNGGIFNSLYNQGYLDYMKCLGIKYIHICPVDNILCKLCDPIWIGYTEANNLTICSKFVKKAYAEEKVGMHVLINDKPCMIEYSEMIQDDLNKTNDIGDLLYDAGGIAQMICTVEFTHQIYEDPQTRSKLAANYHVAQKKYDYYDLNQRKVIKPESINALKFELFYFDCFPLCPEEQFGLIEVRREDEFAPIKNAPGEKSDTPETAKKLYMDRDQKWVKDYGFSFPQQIEISAKITYFGEGLENILPKYLGNKQNPLIITNDRLSTQKQPQLVKQPQPTQQPLQQPQQQQQQSKQPIKQSQKGGVKNIQFYPQVVYSQLINLVQNSILQTNYYPYQSTPQNSRNIQIQEYPVHQSQVFNQRLSMQHQAASQQQLKQVKPTAFPTQSISTVSTTKLINPQRRYQPKMHSQNLFTSKQVIIQPVQVNSSRSPQRMTLYFKQRATTVQRPTMFVQQRLLIVSAQQYTSLTTIKQ